MAKSKSGASPRRESLKPFLPFWLPWHAPWLQPPRDRTAMTSLRKLTGSARAAHGSASSAAATSSGGPRVGTRFMRGLAAGRVQAGGAGRRPDGDIVIESDTAV